MRCVLSTCWPQGVCAAFCPHVDHRVYALRFVHMLTTGCMRCILSTCWPQGVCAAFCPHVDHRVYALRFVHMLTTRCMRCVLSTCWPQGVCTAFCPHVDHRVYALVSVSGWMDSRAIVRPEGLGQWNIPVTPLRIKPTTFRLVTQCLNHLRYHYS
jgi:hypothetical protein